MLYTKKTACVFKHCVVARGLRLRICVGRSVECGASLSMYVLLELARAASLNNVRDAKTHHLDPLNCPDIRYHATKLSVLRYGDKFHF